MPLVFGIVVFLLVIFTLSFIFLFGSIGPLKRVSLVTQANSGEVTYSLFDFDEGTVSNIRISPDTQVTVARSLGNWKLGVVGKLGENEKIGGLLLAETVTKSLKMPSYYWGESVYGAFGDGSFGGVLKAVFSFKKTSLTFADRVKIAFFSLGVRGSQRRSMNLTETKYLSRSKLEDGSLGYKVKEGDMPFELKAILADNDISNEGSNIMLENGSGRDSAPTFIGAVIAVMGGKLSSISKVDANDTYCVIHGDAKLVTYQAIAKTFDCKKEGKLSDYNFDIVIRIGKIFAARN